MNRFAEVNVNTRVWVGDTMLVGTGVDRLVVSSAPDLDGILRLSTHVFDDIVFWRDFVDGQTIDIWRYKTNDSPRERIRRLMSFEGCEKMSYFSNNLVARRQDQASAITFTAVFRCRILWDFLGDRGE